MGHREKSLNFIKNLLHVIFSYHDYLPRLKKSEQVWPCLLKIKVKKSMNDRKMKGLKEF